MAEPTIHELKTWPKYFEQVRSGKKTFEIRVYDRPFQVGDVLRLKEFNPDTQEYTGRQTSRTISYVLRNAPWYLDRKACVMGFEYVLPEEDINP